MRSTFHQVNMPSLRAQSTIEFIILVGVMLMFFLGILYVFYGTLAEKTGSQRQKAVEDIAESVQKELQLALTASEGYQRTFSLPPNAYGQNYTASIVGNNSVYVSLDNGKYSLLLPTPSVQGNLNKTINLVRKENGTIYLN
jgi:hypothetical protein